MTKRAFDQTAEGLNEALAVARGEIAPFRLQAPAQLDVKAALGRARAHLKAST